MSDEQRKNLIGDQLLRVGQYVIDHFDDLRDVFSDKTTFQKIDAELSALQRKREAEGYHWREGFLEIAQGERWKVRAEMLFDRESRVSRMVCEGSFADIADIPEEYLKDVRENGRVHLEMKGAEAASDRQGEASSQ